MKVVDEHDDWDANPRHPGGIDHLQLNDSSLAFEESLSISKIIEQRLVAAFLNGDDGGLVVSESSVLLSLVNAEVGAALLKVLLAGEELLDSLLDLGLSGCCLTLEDESVDPSFVRIDEPFEEVLKSWTVTSVDDGLDGSFFRDSGLILGDELFTELDWIGNLKLFLYSDVCFMLGSFEELVTTQDLTLGFVVLLGPELVLVGLQRQHLTFLVLLHEVNGKVISLQLVELWSSNLGDFDVFRDHVFFGFINCELGKTVAGSRILIQHMV